MEDHAKVREATTHLHQVKIPKLAQTLPTLLENQISNSICESDLANLKTTLHKHGVNLRQLGLLLYHVKGLYLFSITLPFPFFILFFYFLLLVSKKFY